MAGTENVGTEPHCSPVRARWFVSEGRRNFKHLANFMVVRSGPL